MENIRLALALAAALGHPGGSKPALELFRDFMSRDPDTAAFLRRFASP